MKLEPSNIGKATQVIITEQKAAQVQYAVNATHHTHQGNVQHLVRNVINVDIKIILVLAVGRNKRAREMATIKDHHKEGAQRDVTDLKADAPDQDQEVDPTHKVPTAKSSMMTKIKKIQQIKCSLPFTDPNLCQASATRQIQMAKTKIITLLKIKLPHRDVIDNLQVKIDDSAEANILPLDSFRSMFPHALNEESYLTEGFLRGPRTNL